MACASDALDRGRDHQHDQRDEHVLLLLGAAQQRVHALVGERSTTTKIDAAAARRSAPCRSRTGAYGPVAGQALQRVEQRHLGHGVATSAPPPTASPRCR